MPGQGEAEAKGESKSGHSHREADGVTRYSRHSICTYWSNGRIQSAWIMGQNEQQLCYSFGEPELGRFLNGESA